MGKAGIFWHCKLCCKAYIVSLLWWQWMEPIRWQWGNPSLMGGPHHLTFMRAAFLGLP